MRTLSVRPVWAWCMFHAERAKRKDVENRSWRTHYRGPLLIHASQTLRDIGYDCDAADRILRPGQVPDLVDIGAIVGRVILVDCVRNHRSRWALKNCWNWVLSDPEPCDPVECNGKLGLWEYDPSGLLWLKRK